MSEDREDVQKTGISRRRFLGLSARLGGAALLASTGLAEKNAHAQEGFRSISSVAVV